MSSTGRKQARRAAPSRATWYAAAASDHVPISEESAHEVGQAVGEVIKYRPQRKGPISKRGKVVAVNIPTGSRKEFSSTAVAKLTKADKKSLDANGVKITLSVASDGSVRLDAPPAAKPF